MKLYVVGAYELTLILYSLNVYPCLLLCFSVKILDHNYINAATSLEHLCSKPTKDSAKKTEGTAKKQISLKQAS